MSIAARNPEVGGGTADHAAASREPRVLIVSADMGAGHTAVAAELARRLDQRGAHAEVADLITLAGRAGARLRSTYRLLLRRAPWLYDAAMRFWAWQPRPMELLTAADAQPFERALARAVDRFAPDVVVSTYNLAGQCLGRLVRRGAVRVPVLTVVVDPGAHPYWVSPWVDAHLALTDQTADRLAGYGAAGVARVAPVLRPEFAAPPGRAAARRRLGLPDGLVVLLTAGSWAAGRVSATLEVVRRIPDATPVVLCGRDGGLARRLGRLDGVYAVGWTDAVADYLAAADVVVDNAGGQTCWEALACRTPVVMYRPLPGHGAINAAALDAAGLATWVRRSDRLAEQIRNTARTGCPSAVDALFAADDATDHVLAATTTVVPT